MLIIWNREENIMTNDHTIVDKFIENLSGNAKEWVTIFVNYMRSNYSDLEEVISFQMPTYKLGSGVMRNYIAFGTGKNHFSLHTTDFEYITGLKSRLKNAGKGKGCVNVKYSNKDEMDILFDAIKDICNRAGK